MAPETGEEAPHPKARAQQTQGATQTRCDLQENSEKEKIYKHIINNNSLH